MSEKKSTRDVERFVPYSYNIGPEAWPEENFYRDLEFGNPELLDIPYYRALRASMREKIDPAERTPRMNLGKLLEDPRRSREDEQAEMNMDKGSYMDLISKDPGSMFDFAIYEEMKAQEEKEAKINALLREQEKGLEPPVSEVHEKQEDMGGVPGQTEPPEEPVAAHDVIQEPGRMFHPVSFVRGLLSAGWLRPGHRRRQEPGQVPEIGSEVQSTSIILASEFERLMQEAQSMIFKGMPERTAYTNSANRVPELMRASHEYQAFKLMKEYDSRGELNEENIQYAASLHALSLSRIFVFLKANDSLEGSKRIRKAIDRILYRRQLKVVREDIKKVRQIERTEKRRRKA